MVSSHFVPQFYLKKFTFNEKQLAAFDKKDDRQFPPTVRSQCARPDYFKLEGAEHFKELNFDPNYLENSRILSNEMEGPVSSILYDIVSEKSIAKMADEEWAKLFSWFAWIYVMSPCNKQAIDEAFQKWQLNLANLTGRDIEQLIKESKVNLTVEEFRSCARNKVLQYTNAMKLQTLMNSLDGIVNCLFQYSWRLNWVDPKQGAIITGDRPLSLAGKDLFEPIGFDKADYIMFPITPSLLLTGKRFDDIRGFSSVLSIMGPNEILLPNLVVYAKSERFVYAKEFTSFDFITQKKFPGHISLISRFEWCDKKNQHVFVNY